MPSAQPRDARRNLPALHRLLAMEEALALLARHPRAAVRDALRRELAALRATRAPFRAAPFFAAAERALDRAATPGLRRVLNATGVVLHTGLGRAPLAPAALEAVAEAARGYASVELDLDTGRRGDRHAGCAALLREVAGAEDALVVNNGAAALLLALSALAAGGEAVVSRGELVEIGGGFRIPDVIRQGGARLAETGTTNRTRLADYEAAIGPETRALLVVHRSNYRIIGFTATPEPASVAALAHARGLAAIHDLGSGAVLDLSRHGLPREPTLAEAVACGFDLVTCSGDKLLGGPQAGIVAGRAEAVARCAQHPLMRALRPDKMTLAALEATLRLHRDGAGASVPAIAMLAAPPEAIAARAERLRAAIGDRAELRSGSSLVGGGAMPEAELPTTLVAIAAADAADLAARLRRGRPPLLARIAEGRLLLDPRTLAEAEIAEAGAALRAALGA